MRTTREVIGRTGLLEEAMTAVVVVTKKAKKRQAEKKDSTKIQTLLLFSWSTLLTRLVSKCLFCKNLRLWDGFSFLSDVGPLFVAMWWFFSVNEFGTVATARIDCQTTVAFQLTVAVIIWIAPEKLPQEVLNRFFYSTVRTHTHIETNQVMIGHFAGQRKDFRKLFERTGKGEWPQWNQTDKKKWHSKIITVMKGKWRTFIFQTMDTKSNFIYVEK